MVDLALSDDEKLVQETMARFARDELRTLATDADRLEKAPDEILRKGHVDLALAAMSIPEAFGGAWDGSPHQVQLAIRLETLGNGCAGLALAMPGPGLAAPALVKGIATDDQAKKILAPFAEDKPVWAALALVEADAGADFSAFDCVAEKSGSGWIVRGRKTPVVNAARAQGYVVVAKAPDGLRVLWVAREQAAVKVKEGKYVGLRAAGMGDVTFENAVAELLGADDAKAHEQAAKLLLDYARLSVAALAAGVAKAALDTAIEFSKTRVQFGEPIGQKQGIAFLEADMAMEAEGARLMVYRAASLAAAGKNFSASAARAHAYACQAAAHATLDAVQIHGGYGFIREYPVEKWMRDAKALCLIAGSPGDSLQTAGALL
ncbi:MAG: acyl-CoA dehydrogenase family protein [Bdellovibrionota bacterium]